MKKFNQNNHDFIFNDMPSIHSLLKSKGKKKPLKLNHLSPSPRNNPFCNLSSMHSLPKLRPISPVLIKIPTTSRKKFPISSSAPLGMISLKMSPKPERNIRNIETPKFVDNYTDKT